MTKTPRWEEDCSKQTRRTEAAMVGWKTEKNKKQTTEQTLAHGGGALDWVRQMFGRSYFNERGHPFLQEEGKRWLC